MKKTVLLCVLSVMTFGMNQSIAANVDNTNGGNLSHPVSTANTHHLNDKESVVSINVHLDSDGKVKDAKVSMIKNVDGTITHVSQLAQGPSALKELGVSSRTIKNLQKASDKLPTSE